MCMYYMQKAHKNNFHLYTTETTPLLKKNLAGFYKIVTYGQFEFFNGNTMLYMYQNKFCHGMTLCINYNTQIILC